MQHNTSFDIKSLLAPAAASGGSAWAAASGGPAAISFGGGLPDPETFPIEELRAAADQVLRQDGKAALQYGGLMGFEGLRQLLAERHQRADGRAISPEQVTLTSGSSHAISLACFAFAAPGDTVLVEAPTFAGSLRAIRSYGARIESAPVDGQGIVVEHLEKTLKRLHAAKRRPKLLYTIPDFHNPAGVTLGLERRKRLVELAQRWGFLVLEDAAYGDLRYDGEPLPSLFALDGSGAVLKLGSFSKIMAAGFRLGWAAGHPDAIAALNAVRHDMGVSAFGARTVAGYAAGGRLGRHIQRLRVHYRAKRDRMASALGEHCAPYVRYAVPEGGFFIWLELAQGVDPDRLARAAAEESVGYVPGTAFFANGEGRRNVRLAFSFAPLDDIDRGIEQLGRALARSAQGPLGPSTSSG